MAHASYSENFEGGAGGWADGGQSTVGVENSSPLAGSASLKVERTAAQGTGPVAATKTMDFTWNSNLVGSVIAASCICQTTGANLSQGRISIRVYSSIGALVESFTSSFVNVTSQNTLSVSGVIATGAASGTIRIFVESDANALDNGTDRLRIDTVVATQDFAQSISGGGTPAGALTTSFIAGPFGVPLLRPVPRVGANVYRM